MNRKRLSLCILVLISICVLLAACDHGLRYVQMDIVELPQKLIYSTQDTALDLTGGVVSLTVAEGTKSEKGMDAYPAAGEGEYGVFSDVDFTKPGTYDVVITQCEGVSCVFQIQVVDPAA